jgi:hypothetical protein
VNHGNLRMRAAGKYHIYGQSSQSNDARFVYDAMLLSHILSPLHCSPRYTFRGDCGCRSFRRKIGRAAPGLTKAILIQPVVYNTSYSA